MSDQPSHRFRGRAERTVPHPDPTHPATPGETWGWSGTVGDRPRLPWFGLFLVLLGGLLLIEQVNPAARALGSGLVVAVGAAMIIASIVNRRPWQLYAGAILTAVSLPGLLQDLNVIHRVSGWGTFFLGGAFLVIALIRVGRRGGLGWQLILGVFFTVVGGIEVAQREIPGFPSVGNLFWPVLILALGLWLVLRAVRGSTRS